MKQPEFIWCAWRTKSGWSTRHAVPTREDDRPEDVKGFVTMCMRRVPIDALEYANGPHGAIASRAIERIIPFLFIDRSSGGDICRHCNRILERLSKEDDAPSSDTDHERTTSGETTR